MPPRKSKAVDAKEPDDQKSDAAAADRSGKMIAVAGIITNAVVVSVAVLGGFVWISGEFKDVRKELRDDTKEIRQEIAGLKADLARLDAKVDGHGERIARLEGKVGIDADGGLLDAATDASSSQAWSADHVARREKFCFKRCAADAACTLACATDYNACGIDCPSDPVSPCFQKCVKAIK